jgi:hypothetical protein
VADFFEINPSRVETGVPITVSIRGSEEARAEENLMVTSKDGSPIQTELKAGPEGSRIAQFVLYQEGDYQLKAGTQLKWIHVFPRKDLSIFFELGFLILSVAIFLGGLIVWSRKNRKSKGGSFSPSGPS